MSFWTENRNTIIATILKWVVAILMGKDLSDTNTERNEK